ncbi:uncharacterized protein [Lepeophtheirus salmonis]|uniref:uncharacterized protein n=1 Tax=Lepeophtheirus salmonis TaxID=72036 RepID=UPI001AE660BE|nr:GRIP and coiled-coil domain-containing protein 2-like [Lepeophtheirus salmonis]
METLQSIFDSLSGSMNLGWRDGSFLEWIVSGVPSLNEIEGEGPFGKAKGAFVKHFPGVFLDEGEEEELLTRLKLTLFVSYLASVKHGWQPLKKLLLGLKIHEQRVIERIFSYLLEDKWDETLVKSVKMDTSEASAVPISSYATTPIRRLKRLKSPSSPSTFNYSPSTHFPTLREFFSSPITTQISKYQRIAEDQKRILSLVRLELDQEKLETLNLMKEREELIKDRQTLKKSLAIARQNLLDNQVDMEEEDEEAAYGELQRRLAEKKDSEKYIISLEEQLSETVSEKDVLKRTVNSHKTKLDEMSFRNTELSTKNIQLQVSLSQENDMNTDLNNKCNELEVQVKELQEILNSKRSSKENAGKLLATQLKSGVSVSDISLDDPLMSMPPSPEGENMANALVIPELEEQLALITEERDNFEKRTSLCEEELVLKREEVNHLSDNLCELRQCSENYKLIVENLEKEKTTMDKYLEELTLRKELLQNDYEKVIMDCNSSKEIIKDINQVNEDLQCKINTLNNEIIELRESNSKELNALSANLISSQTSLESLKSHNRSLCDDIETHKSIQSKYESEMKEQKMQIMSITEDLNSLKSVNENLQNEHNIISSDSQSQISSLSTTVDNLKNDQTQLISENEKLICKNRDLTTQLCDYQTKINELTDKNLQLSTQVQECNFQISTINKDLENCAAKNGEFEGKISHLETHSKKLEDEKLENLKKLRCCKDENDNLIAVLKTNEEKLKKDHEELIQNNHSLIAQLSDCKLEIESLQKNTGNLKEKCDFYKGVINTNEDKLREVNDINDKLMQDMEFSKEQNTATLHESEERLNALNKELSMTISAKDKEISNLKSDNCNNQDKSLKKEELLMESNNECKKLNEVIKSLNEEIISKTKVFDSELNSFKENISTHEETLSSFKNNVHELKEKLRTKDEEIESLNTGLNTFSTETFEIKKNLEDIKESKKLIESSLLTANESLKKFETDIKTKTDLIQNLDCKNTELDKIVSNLQKEKVDIEQLSNSQKSELAKLLGELKLLQKDMNSKTEEFNRITSENVKLTSEVKELKASNSTANDAEGNAKTVLEEVKSNLSSKIEEMSTKFESDIKVKTDLIQNLEWKNTELDKIVSNLQKEKVEMKELSNSQKRELANLSDELKLLQKDMNSKTEEFNRVTSENVKLISEVKELKTSNDAESKAKTVLEEVKSNLSSKIEDMSTKFESDIKEKTDLIQNLECKSTELDEIVSNLQKEKVEMKELSNTQKSELANLSDELKLLQKEMNSKTEEFNRIISENVKLTSEVKELKTSNSTENESEGNAKTVLEKVKSNLSSKIEEMSTIQLQLNKELKDKNREYDSLLSQSNAMKIDIIALKKSLDSKSTDYANLQNEVIDFKNKAETKQKEIEALNAEGSKWESNSKFENESLSVQVCELSAELDIKNKALHDLKKDYNIIKDEKSSIESSNKELTNQISKALNAVDNCEKEVTVINNSLSTLEAENLQLREELNALRLTLQNTKSELDNRDLDNLTEKGKYETQLQSYKDEIKTFKKEYSTEELSLQNKFNDKIEKLKEEMEAKSKNDLASQKSRYEVRVKDITEKVTKQYKMKIEQFAKEKDSEMDKLNQKSQDFEKKYNIAKVKLSELVSKLEEMTKENSALQKKYTGTKSMILKLKDENEHTLNKYSHEVSNSMEIETLKRQLNKVQTDNRQLNVQLSTAELKIRSLQKEVTTLNSQQTYQSILPTAQISPARSVFKIPSAGDTPGRTRNGRTQSESNFNTRRPPNGVGALFNVDDEEGEMFSNSYLSDVKEGICTVNQSGRLSELCRRNTLQPSHLKSSYPIETQFYNTDQFKENELQEGKVLTDVRSITKGTANLSVNSPAMNTRSRRTTIGGSANVSPLSTRKRAVLDNSSFNSNTSSIIRYEAKRSRKEAQQTSYSKPGPPTPAKNKSFHSNTSMNRSSTSDFAGLENTPSIRSTQSPNVSNRSLRSRIVDTPLTLKRAVRSAWKKKKSYNMKGKVEENASVIVLDKKRTPLKRLDKRK